MPNSVEVKLWIKVWLSLIVFDLKLYDFPWLDVTHDQGQTISLRWFVLVNHISYRRSSMVYTMQSKLMFLTNEETVLQNNYILKRFPICADMKHILWKHFSETVFCFSNTVNTKFASAAHVSCTRKCANIKENNFPIAMFPCLQVPVVATIKSQRQMVNINFLG